MGFRESVLVTVTTADVPSLLNSLRERGIVTEDVSRVDDMTIVLKVIASELKTIEKLCARRGDDLRIGRRRGILLFVKHMLRRPVLIGGFLLIFAMTLFLPTRVLFIEVEGNTSIPARHILEKASLCGVNFSASRKNVRSEQVKNALLEAMPELQWAGINTRGCVATITVRERPVSDSQRTDTSVSSIVALRDGIVHTLTVTKGSAACRTGQAVKEGQVLISGYTDCGLTIQACRAEGEVYGLTQRDLAVTACTESLQRVGQSNQSKKYSLILGKNRINFYKGSGISDTSCVKMYEEKYITLPGGFVLPIALVTEICQESETAAARQQFSEDWLSVFAEKYLSSHMKAGRIQKSDETFISESGVVSMTGTYQCLEMIGVRKQEEIIKPNE